MPRKARTIAPEVAPINPTPWRSLHPLGLERVRPYFHVHPRDLRNRERVEDWAAATLPPDERRDFQRAWIAWLIADAKAARSRRCKCES